MDDRVKDEAGFISDPALGVLLCANHAWVAPVGGAVAYLVPSDDTGEWWHYGKADTESDTLEASTRPVARRGLASFAAPLGIHGGLDWQPADHIKPGHPNPIVTMFEECR